jgi:hypothetical protein
MIRAVCAVVGTLVLAGPSLPPTDLDVDAVTFALAFREGKADQYKNKQISGSGMSFHGPIQERIADGSMRTSLVMTLGSTDAQGKLTVIKTWDEFVAAERGRTTVVVALSGPSLPATKTAEPMFYEFSGVYDGQVRTIMRVPQAADAAGQDSGPCPGEAPRQGGGPTGGFYCAPLLTGATVTVKAAER